MKTYMPYFIPLIYDTIHSSRRSPVLGQHEKSANQQIKLILIIQYCKVIEGILIAWTLHDVLVLILQLLSTYQPLPTDKDGFQMRPAG